MRPVRLTQRTYVETPITGCMTTDKRVALMIQLITTRIKTMTTDKTLYVLSGGRLIPFSMAAKIAAYKLIQAREQ
jgi:hypothetical protein